jgi:HEAT repeat protein
VRQELGDTLQLLAMDDLPSLLEVLREGGDGAAHLAQALYGHREDATVLALVELLASTSPHDRWSAVWSLSKAGTPGAVEPLLDRLRDPSLPVRVAAVVAVAVHRPAGATDALQALLRRPDLVPAEVQAARAALETEAAEAKAPPASPPRL